MKHFYCVIIMLSVMPITAAFGLITFDPKNWGGPPTFQNVIMMALFGLLSVPLWFTFIPSLVVAPMVMSKFSTNPLFHTIPMWKFLILSSIIGAIAGVVILSPSILMSLDSMKLILNWAWAGALSGAATSSVISLIYR